MMITVVGASILVLLIAVWGFLRVQQKQEAAKGNVPYQKRLNFYNNPERLFLAALMRALGGQYLILGKVKVSDLIGIDQSLPKRQQLAAYEVTMGKCVDFVICDHRTSRILAVIDWVDTEREMPSGSWTQEMDRIFKSVGIPCIRFFRAQQYDVSDIRYAVSSFLQDLPASGPLPRLMS